MKLLLKIKKDYKSLESNCVKANSEKKRDQHPSVVIRHIEFVSLLEDWVRNCAKLYESKGFHL